MARVLAFLFVLIWLAGPPIATRAAAQDVAPPSDAVQGTVPGASKGSDSVSEMWRAVRQGVQGNVSIPDKQAGYLVQPAGEQFLAYRNGPLREYGAWSLLGIVVLLALFFAFRGRIRVDSGFSGRMILRFNFFERFTHWLTAGSFVVLALTGLNMLYGRQVLIPMIGKPAFATLAEWGKLSHNTLGFAFIVGILFMIVIWIRNNLPNRDDLRWIAVGGGLFVKGVHPPARKFNAGQKLIFWTVVIFGLSLGASGIALLFPYQFSMFEGTFKTLNMIGFDLPTSLTALQELQLALIWHSIIAFVLIVIIIAHIYIGSVGMEGAISAVTTGEVDENWAREHHRLWLDEGGHEAAVAPSEGTEQPAE